MPDAATIKASETKAVQGKNNPEKPLRRYRVRAGKHVEGKKDNQRVYTRGQIVETDKDLIRTFGHEKFDRLDVDAQPLETMNVSELQGLATENEIEWSDEMNKRRLIDAIRARRPELG